MKNAIILLTILTFSLIGCATAELFEEIHTDPDCIGAECEEISTAQANFGELVETELDIANFLSPDGDPIDDPVENIVLEDDLTVSERARVDLLRDSIAIGLDIGRSEYIDRVALNLQDLGVMDAYNMIITDEYAGLMASAIECPFAAYYDEDVVESTEHSCDYLVTMSIVETYSELSQILIASPLPGDILESEHAREAEFWFEQGAISGIEEERVRIRFELEAAGLCNAEPTAIESSQDKGRLIGRQLFAAELNSHLVSLGFESNYPEMTEYIPVCNADIAMLEPALGASLDNIDAAIALDPLCDNYSPPTMEASLQYAQAQIDYEEGVRAGIEDEFAMAAVSVFQEITCVVTDPIVVDLDNDGIELTTIEDGVNFDLWATGRAQAISWVQPDDGFLALDRNNNGVIDDGSELFGNIGGYEDGVKALTALDSDRNGMIDNNDDLFSELVIWQDTNTDGTSAPNELINIASVGIILIPLYMPAVELTSGGNRIVKASYMLAFDGILMFGDANLRTAPHARLTFADYGSYVEEE